MEVVTHWRIKRNIKEWMEDYLKGKEMRTVVVKDENFEWREDGDHFRMLRNIRMAFH